MNIQSVTPNFTGSVTYRVAKDYAKNKNIHNLDGKVLKVLREQKLPAIIHNRHIDISFDKQYQQANAQIFKDTLKSAGIEFKLLV